MTILNITDGTTTVNLIWDNAVNRKYMLSRDGWAPQIAGRRRSVLGGRGPYSDVEEEIALTVLGGSASDALANLATLLRLMDGTLDFWDGRTTTPIRIQYAPEGATLGEALILGYVDTPAELSPTINRDLRAYMIDGVKLRLTRRGQWIGLDEVASSSSSNNPAKLSATLSIHPTSSPLKIDLAGFTTANTPALPDSVLLVAPGAAYLSIFDASAMTVGADPSYATFNDTAKKPYNGTNVLRFTPPNTSPAETGGLADLSFTNAYRVQVFVVLRNTSSFATFQVRANLTSDAGVVSTPYETVDIGVTTPRILALAPVSLALPVNGISLEISVSDTSTGPFLDISHIVVINLADERCRALAIDGTTPGMTGGSYTITVDDRILSGEAPVIRAIRTASEYRGLSWHGDAMLATYGTTVTALWLATGGFTADRWRFTTAADALVSNSITTTRHAARLLPQ
jgi:hypothetical protein